MTTIPAPTHRIERCGNLLVYIPLTPQVVKVDAYELRRFLSVASA